MNQYQPPENQKPSFEKLAKRTRKWMWLSYIPLLVIVGYTIRFLHRWFDISNGSLASTLLGVFVFLAVFILFLISPILGNSKLQKHNAPFSVKLMAWLDFFLPLSAYVGLVWYIHKYFSDLGLWILHLVILVASMTSAGQRMWQ